MNSPQQQPRSRRRTWLFRCGYVLYLMVLALIGVKLFLWLGFGIPPTESTDDLDVLQYYYREFGESGVLDRSAKAHSDRFDVLLLGGSVLEQAAPALEKRLRGRFGDRLRIYNLAIAAHTTRDSYLKYFHIDDRSFDLIVIYHGINDVRMNCVAESEFRTDYTHCAWYNSLRRRVAAGRVNLAQLLTDQVERLIPLDQPDTELLRFGQLIKTPPAFHANLDAIVTDAGQHKCPVLLLTFAFHLPDDYTRERFENGELDYGDGLHRLAAEVWGLPDSVRAGIMAHNRQVRRVAASRANVTLVPLDEILPKTGRIFSDVCHLTPVGCREFARHATGGMPSQFPIHDSSE